jgi:predicted MPP superfamily phosphohydrolase
VKRLLRTTGWGLLAGAAAAAYAAYEPYRFRLETKRVPVRAGTPAVTILHVSDTHLRTDTAHTRRFLEGLPEALGEVPDLVVATGDFTNDDPSMVDAVALLNGLEARLGRFFVYGSHDYFESGDFSFSKYFTRASSTGARRRDEGSMTEALEAAGWKSAVNRTEVLETEAGRIRIAGVDDPYLDWHRTGHIERDSEDDLAIALVHAPDVVSEWALNGYDLVVAGHTHGGQVRLPGVGALVTNCSLPAELAAGLTRIGDTWLHVSPGLGNGPYTPIRFGCRPEATLLRLEPESS